MPNKINMGLMVPVGGSELRHKLKIIIPIDNKLSSEAVENLKKLIVAYAGYHCGFVGIEEVDFQKAPCRTRYPKTEKTVQKIVTLSEKNEGRN